jgi:hypothetical protein
MKHLSDAPLYGRLLALLTNIRLSWKGLAGTNALAYYEKSSLKAVKSFITLATGVNVIKLFSIALTMRSNKLKHLSFESLSSQVLEFEGKARANSIGALFRCFLLRLVTRKC